MKGEERMVCHFFRDNWPCKVMDKHLGILCKQHLECKFAKVRKLHQLSVYFRLLTSFGLRTYTRINDLANKGLEALC
jgi:hypothetical protein